MTCSEDDAARALSLKTAKADGLVRRLARLTNETMTEAVTIAVRERLSREEARRAEAKELPARVAARMRGAYDTRPVGKAEWGAASDDETCWAGAGEGAWRIASSTR